jgi:hypothetical protein
MRISNAQSASLTIDMKLKIPIAIVFAAGALLLKARADITHNLVHITNTKGNQ